MTILLLTAGLLIGNFVTPAEACLPPDTLTAPGYISREHRTLTHRMSRRTLRDNVRKGWKN